MSCSSMRLSINYRLSRQIRMKSGRPAPEINAISYGINHNFTDFKKQFRWRQGQIWGKILLSTRYTLQCFVPASEVYSELCD